MEIKNKIYFENIIIVKKNGEIHHIEAVPGSTISKAIQDIKLLLTILDLKGEYALIFNEKTINISKYSNLQEKINEYIALCNHSNLLNL